jgi:hypothetical protein
MCETADDCATLLCENDQCVEVECVGNADCADLAGTCVVGECDQVTNTCQAVPAFEGAACNDGDECTNATCGGGVCGGPAVDCSAYDGQCTVGACDPNTGCFGQPTNEGMTCSDTDACTSSTACAAGECVGEIVDCSHLDVGCHVGQCNAVSGQCEVQTLANGAACDDGFACSTNDTCDEGVCVPGNLTAFWTEDFADNDAGWTLDQEWEIGPAASSAPAWGRIQRWTIRRAPTTVWLVSSSAGARRRPCTTTTA